MQGKPTPGPWKYGVRDDGTMWLSIGDPKGERHYQGDLCASPADADLIVSAKYIYEALREQLEFTPGGPCQRGLVEKCRCERCKDKRAIYALSRAEGRDA